MEKIVQWKNLNLIIRDTEKSHANGGRLGKLWVEDINSGRLFLVKGSSPFSYEPYSEKMAYIIGKNIGIDVLEYDLVPAELFAEFMYIHPMCKYVSICEKIDKKGYCISSIAEIKRARNALIDNPMNKVKNREVMYELLPKEYIDTMLLFDAIIGNEDRHYGNVHILRSTNGEIVGAPILDNGASLLALVPTWEIALLGNRIGELSNKSFTIDVTHDKQLEEVDSVNNISFNITITIMKILREIEPVLQMLPTVRANGIKRFIVYRLHKYLGMIKYDNNREYFKRSKNRTLFLREREISRV